MADTTMNNGRRFSRLTMTIFWSAIIAAITITLLTYERIDILYVLATIALVVLLVVVANADLEGKTKVNNR